MTDTPPKPIRRRWLLFAGLMLIPILIAGLAVGLPYYRWMTILSMRGSLLALYQRLGPAIDSALAHRQGGDWAQVQKAATDTFSANDKSSRRWAAWCLTRHSRIDTSATPLVLMLIDQPSSAGSSPQTCASVISSKVALNQRVGSGDSSDSATTDFVADNERLLVLFVDGTVTQMTAAELIEHLEHTSA